MAVVEVQIIPIGTSTPSLSKYVADCVKVLQKYNDITYQVFPMGTVLEGELDSILKVVREMHEVPFDNGAMRVVSTIRIDERRDRKLTMNGKVTSVTTKLKKDC